MNEIRSGISYPFRFKDGGLAREQGLDKIAGDLRHLISTRLEERTMLRTYGGGIHTHVQDPASPTLRALIKHEIEQALRLFLPEVRLAAPVSVTAREGELTVCVDYFADPRVGVQRLELPVV
jgi:phage baseplate assembly protein W